MASRSQLPISIEIIDGDECSVGVLLGGESGG